MPHAAAYSGSQTIANPHVFDKNHQKAINHYVLFDGFVMTMNLDDFITKWSFSFRKEIPMVFDDFVRITRFASIPVFIPKGNSNGFLTISCFEEVRNVKKAFKTNGFAASSESRRHPAQLHVSQRGEAANKGVGIGNIGL